MKIVIVRYTTTEEYATQNKRNIEKVANELKIINHPGIKFRSYLLADGKTFIHFDQFKTEEAHQFLQSIKSFKKFSEELWSRGLLVEPKFEQLSMVVTSI